MRMNINQMLVNKIIAECNYIISGGDHNYLKTVKDINEYFVSLIRPKNLDGGNKNNVVIQFAVNFEQLCIALMSNGTPDPKKMTVLRFYSALKYFDERKPKEHEGARHR